MSRSFLVALSFLLLAPLYTVVAYVSPGAPSGYVNDFTQTLSAGERSTLESTLAAFHASTTKEVAVAIVPSLGGDDIESYANTLFREWGIGDKERNDGVLLLVALKEHQMRIEVGYGNEGTLTDARSSRIIRETMTPLFKAGKYGEGITLGVADILAVLQGDTGRVDGLTPEQSSKLLRALEGHITELLFFLLMGMSWLASILGRTKSWWLGGVFGAVIGGAVMLFAGLSIGLIAGMILIPLGLLFDFVVSRGYKHSRASGATPPWWTGGSGFGGGSFGGGGFGGFGGGSSGGGGASGRW